MTYSPAIPMEENKMLLFWRKKKAQEDKTQEMIDRIHKESLKKTEKANKELDKITKLLEENPDDIAAMIFYSTGGFRREK